MKLAPGFSLAAALILSVVTGSLQISAADKGPTIFASVSLKDALDAVASDWVKRGGAQPVIA
ncbi:MAG: hypothetical protein ACREDO_03990 [Methyloceanibacter sp.]